MLRSLMIPRVSSELFLASRTNRVSPSSDYFIPRQGKRPRRRPDNCFGDCGVRIDRNLRLQLPLRPKASPRRVNRKSRWPLWGGSAARFGRSAEPLCWFSRPPVCLAADTFLWTASERSFGFGPGSLTIRQRQCRHHFEPAGGPASDSDVLRQARTNHGAHVLPADRSSSPAAAAITSPTSSQFSSATLTIAADCPGWRSHSARAAFRLIGTDGH